MFRYTLNSNKKFKCPECGHLNRFVKYLDNSTGLYLDGNFGKCDREESCGYHLKPAIEFINQSESKIKYIEKDLYDSDCLDSDIYIESFHLINNLRHKIYSKKNLGNNVFINELLKRFDSNKVRKAYKLYRLGMGFNGSTIFPYYFNNCLKSAKIIHFKHDLHRNKDISPMWLHSTKTFRYYDSLNKNKEEVNNICYPEENKDYEYYLFHPDDKQYNDSEPFNYCLPLFGWDILEVNKDKTICLVESEKTCVICSICFPQFVWLATGGKNNLQQYKFNYYNGRNWLIFADLSKDNTTLNKWKEGINKIKEKYDMNESYIDCLPVINAENKDYTDMAIDKGYDIADFILDYPYNGYIEYMTELLKPFCMGSGETIINSLPMPEPLIVPEPLPMPEPLTVPEPLIVSESKTLTEMEKLENLKFINDWLINMTVIRDTKEFTIEDLQQLDIIMNS